MPRGGGGPRGGGRQRRQAAVHAVVGRGRRRGRRRAVVPAADVRAAAVPRVRRAVHAGSTVPASAGELRRLMPHRSRFTRAPDLAPPVSLVEPLPAEWSSNRCARFSTPGHVVERRRRSAMCHGSAPSSQSRLLTDSPGRHCGTGYSVRRTRDDRRAPTTTTATTKN